MNMNSQMMDFGMGMPDLVGTKWWSRDGRDHFVVRDILMSDTGFMIHTMDGRQLDGDIMDRYIQSDEPVQIPQEAPVEKINLKALDTEGAAGDISVAPDSSLGSSLRYSRPGVQFQEPGQRPTQRTQQPARLPVDNVDAAMIDRVLGKCKFEGVEVIMMDDPILNTGIDALVQTLNVSRSSIREYIIDRIADGLMGIAARSVNTYLDGILGPDKEPEPEVTVEVPAENTDDDILNTPLT